MEQFINDVFEIIEPLLPSYWKKLAFHMSVEDRILSMFFFIRGVSKNFLSNSYLEKEGFFSKEEFRTALRKVGEITMSYATQFEEEMTGYTMVVDRDGHVSVDFEYGEQPLSISDAWKQEYLK